MQNEMTLDTVNTATLRLVNSSWANYLQNVCGRLKTLGCLCRNDGTEALIKRLKQARPQTYLHCARVARYSNAMGRAFGFDQTRLKHLTHAAVLHDVGKILIPETVLNRPRKLSPTEMFILRKHPGIGAMLASYFNLPAELRVRIQHHHERWDGRGYPHKLGGADVPLMARIIQVADTYDAMTAADRPYRAPLSHADAVEELRREAGKQFDPRVIEAFIDNVSEKL